MTTYTDISNRLKQNNIDQYAFRTIISVNPETKMYQSVYDGIIVYAARILLEKRKQEMQLLLSDMNIKIDLDKNREEITIELLR